MEQCNSSIRPVKGHTQIDRILAAPKPEEVRLINYSETDWLRFTQLFSKLIKYYNFNNESSTTWESFFKELPIDTIENEDYSGDLKPHLTLFFAFLKMLKISTDKINNITKRHLDFYYKEVLKLKHKPMVKDRVYVLFELAKNIEEHNLSKDTELKAGKDNIGKPIFYNTLHDIRLNTIKIKSIKKAFGNKTGIYLGEQDLEDINTIDYPFGSPNNPKATTGFSIQSHDLKLNEGDKTITLVLKLKDKYQELLNLIELDKLQFQFTGEKEWLSFTLDKNPRREEQPDPNSLTYYLITKEEIFNFNPEVHSGTFSTEMPVLKLLIPMNHRGIKTVKSLNKYVKSITLKTNYSVEKDVVMSNDFGEIDTDVPFYPFGIIPTKNTKFIVHSNEWKNKNITRTKLTLNWKNTPESFYKYHEEYKIDNRRIITKHNAARRFRVFKGRNQPIQSLFSTERLSEGNTVVAKNSVFNFSNTEINSDYSLVLKLEKDFLHSEYHKIYTTNILDDPSNPNIPNEPFAPIAESYSIKVDTLIKVPINANPNFNWITVYGQQMAQKQLIPKPLESGNLYLGLENVNKNQTLTMLLSFDEGSESAEAINLSGIANIQWKYLYQNKWVRFSDAQIQRNQCPNFLKTGIVQLILPNEIHTENTLMPKGLFWIKAEANNINYASVCKLTLVKTNAIEAEFNPKNNQRESLILPKETINSLNKKQAQIKKTTQPFSSFNGKAEETDANFYKRISERLKHKNRAITSSDYEHLILNKFEDIFQVKCYNYHDKILNVKPGQVVLLVVPDIRNKNVFNIYKPGINYEKIQEIETYINTLNSLHVTAEICAPQYEEVEINSSIKFKEGLDVNFYANQLKQELAKFLAPWAFNRAMNIQFKTGIHQSQVIYFIEKRDYVDYVKDFQMKRVGETSQQEITPSSALSVLTSVMPDCHIINPIKDDKCTA